MRASPTTNLEPGLSDARMKDFITIALPMVPDIAMKMYRIICARSVALYGGRNEIG